jgi:Spy/CpxP family protein refolding chaperone
VPTGWWIDFSQCAVVSISSSLPLKKCVTLTGHAVLRSLAGVARAGVAGDAPPSWFYEHIRRRYEMKILQIAMRRFTMLVMLGALLGAAGIASAQSGPMMGMNPDEMQKYMKDRPGGYGSGMGPMGMGGGMMDGMGMMGMGHGMMGMGMMGGMGPFGMLNLSDEQRGKLDKIQDESRRKHWDLMGKVMDESAKLRDLYREETLDAKKIGAVYDRVFKLQREAVDASIDALNKANAVLTKEQRDEWQRMKRGMPMGPGMPGMHRQVPAR